MTTKKDQAHAVCLLDRIYSPKNPAGYSEDEYIKVVKVFALYFREDSARFDTARFYKACGLTENQIKRPWDKTETENRNRIFALESRVKDLEYRLVQEAHAQQAQAIANPESVPAVKDIMDKLRAQIADPNHQGGTCFIEAIKMVRSVTNWGLKEAKDWTEKTSGYRPRY